MSGRQAGCAVAGAVAVFWQWRVFLCCHACPLCAGGCGPGYEKYNSMRADPALCFLERVGMPDAKAIAAEQRGTDMLADGGDG